jgi:hypothetical protein
MPVSWGFSDWFLVAVADLGGPRRGLTGSTLHNTVGGTGDVAAGGTDPDGQEAASHSGAGAFPAGLGALPLRHELNLARVRERELAQGGRRLRVGGLGRLAEPAVGPGLRDGVAVVRAVAGVGGHHRPRRPGPGCPSRRALWVRLSPAAITTYPQ